MTQARMTKFLAYVKRVNELFNADVQATFELSYRCESLKLWIHDDDGNKYYIYHTNPALENHVNGNIYTVFDANLAKAEKHIRRIILEGINGDDEREVVSG